MVEIRRYDPDNASTWDNFVETSRNGTFLFKRAYMGYHSDRFIDHSLMFYNAKGALLALLPANLAEHDGTLALYSHEGLTYGGLIVGDRAGTDDVLDIFRTTLAYLSENGFKMFYYKQMPTCYHLYPAQEDEYALWRMGAEIVVCNISTTIDLSQQFFHIPLQYRRKRGIARAARQGYTICETTDIAAFWRMMEDNLRTRYDASPVHSMSEMQLLMGRFPDNIKCFVAMKDNSVEAGVIIYLCRNVAHAQYIQSSPVGRADGALDLLLSTLIDSFALRYKYFDLGTSNEDGGYILNSNLIAQKEHFGGRGTTYKQWRFLI